MKSKAKSATREMVLVENRNVPGYTHSVDSKKYAAMKRALLKILPKKPPGITQKEMFETVKGHLSADDFPGGAKAEWWAKTVQLDLEAKGLVDRDAKSKPMRWFRARYYSNSNISAPFRRACPVHKAMQGAFAVLEVPR